MFKDRAPVSSLLPVSSFIFVHNKATPAAFSHVRALSLPPTTRPVPSRSVPSCCGPYPSRGIASVLEPSSPASAPTSKPADESVQLSIFLGDTLPPPDRFTDVCFYPLCLGNKM